MGLFDRQSGGSSLFEASSSGSTGLFGQPTKKAGSGFDLQTPEGLRDFARSRGFEAPEPEKKLSALQRFTKLISSIETGNALYESRYEGKNFVGEYVKDVFTDVGSAISGKDIRQAPKKTYKDVLLEEGFKDREGKVDVVDIAGFFGDVLLDPSTYFGGAIAKGVGKVAKVGGKGSLAVARKLAPKATLAGEAAFGAAKDALGGAFVNAYKVAPGADDLVVEGVNKANRLVTQEVKEITSIFKKLPKDQHVPFMQTGFKLRQTAAKARNELVQEGMEKAKMEMREEVINDLGFAKIGKTQEQIISDQVKKRMVSEGIEDAVVAEATKKVNKNLDKLAPVDMFDTPEQVRFYTKNLKPYIDKRTKRLKEYKGKENAMYLSVYFPAVKTETAEKLGRALQVSSEGYAKAYKGALEWGDVVQDPSKAYALRAAQVEKDQVIGRTLNDLVAEYGKPVTEFANAKEAADAGFQVIKKMGSYGEEIGYLDKYTAKYIKELYDPSFKAVDDLAKALGYDKATGLFKKSVTGLFPAFHVRNYVSGHIQNFEVLGLAALRPDNITTGTNLSQKALKESADLSGELKLGKFTMPMEDFITKFRDRFGLSSQYLSDFGWEVASKDLNKKGLFEVTRWLGNHVETQQKMVATVTALRKGYTLDEALKFAEKSGFDYSRLTPFEKSVMRRLIPFYSFTRKNVELQLNTLAKNPERLGALMKAGRAVGSPQGIEDSDMPDWMRNRFTANFGKSKYGLPQVVSGFGTPMEATADLFDGGLMGILSTLNPLLKVPLEKAIGKDFFRERDLKDVYSAKEYGNAPKIIKDWLQITEKKQDIYKNGKKIGTKTVHVADPDRLHIARNLFTSRGFSLLHTMFGDGELTTKARIVNGMSGLKAYEIDKAQNEYFQDRDNSRDLIDLFQRMGLVKTFEITTVAK